MLGILGKSWALFIGLFLLMVGNGLQGSLLGLRGAMEGFNANTMAWVMSAYFVGFLGGSRITPILIARVGHVRVFAALASFVSAAFILYAAFPDPIAWVLLRLMVGFCISGVYVIVESWLNASVTNDKRGQALSLYLVVQMVGIISAQALLNFGNPGEYILFVTISVLVSISFAPILLSASPAPMFQASRPMSLVQLYHVSPLGIVGMFALGAVFSALFGMAPVYATEKGLSIAETSIFISAIYLGGMLFQFPIGWLSDRMERRKLIVSITAFGAISTLALFFLPSSPALLVLAAFLVGGVANPLYSLLIAHANDYIDYEEMAAASGGLLFFNGIGAIGGPFVVGAMMAGLGADAFFAYLGGIFGFIALYGLYRSTKRSAPSAEDTSSYTAIAPQATVVALEVAQEVAIDRALDDAAEQEANA